MTEKEKTTEVQILNAAKKVFLKKGYDGARMQHIADEAGINKALLHYYFRSKDKLFDAIFDEAFSQFFPNISTLMMSDQAFEKKIRGFVSHYIDTMLKNPHLPSFVMHELQRKPERIVGLIRQSGIDPETLGQLIEKEVAAGKMRPIPFPHLIVNLVSMCIMPFAARPIIEGFVFNGNTRAYDHFLSERKTAVADFIINSLKLK